MSGRKNRSPINRSILIGCGGLILALCLLLSLHTYRSFSGALYEQYNGRLREVLTEVEESVDADDLRECVRTGVSSPKRDALQQRLNRMVDNFDLMYIYIVIPQGGEQTAMTSVVSSTSEAERAAGEEDMPLLLTS